MRYLIAALLLFSSCKKNPLDRIDTAASGAMPTDSPSTAFVVYRNGEITSGGGAGLYPGSDEQTINFNDSGAIRYMWTGRDVGGQHVFAGFDLCHSPDLSPQWYWWLGKDLSEHHFSKISFYIKGSLSKDTVVKIESPHDGINPNAGNKYISSYRPCKVLSNDGIEPIDPGTGFLLCRDGYNPGALKLTSSWQKVTMSAPNEKFLWYNIRDFFKATFVFVGNGTGSGGVIYVDKVQYDL